MMSKDPALRPSDGANLAVALAALGPLVHSAAGGDRAWETARDGDMALTTTGDGVFARDLGDAPARTPRSCQAFAVLITLPGILVPLRNVPVS